MTLTATRPRHCERPRISPVDTPGVPGLPETRSRTQSAGARTNGGHPERTPRCRCGTRWHQRGDQTGHCSGCHLTFRSLRAFDLHRRDGQAGRVCLHPREVTKRDGRPALVSRHDGLTDVWGQPATTPTTKEEETT